MGKKWSFYKSQVVPFKTRLFEPFNLIGKVELMTTFMKLDPIFVYAQIFPWLIFSQ